MHKWSHLANARHIDWVLKSIKQDSKVWREYWCKVDSVAWITWVESWKVAEDLIGQDPDRARVWAAAEDVAWKLVRTETQWMAREAARGVLAALVAWDDLDRYLNLHHEQLKFISLLSERPETRLLLPMSYVRERIHA